ncbi:O-antigen ligase family protein [Nocardioides bizhenqiangii]|uniref:O-antigen ligase family protein n=1 Tax=Nocardioides bizhenqiangii TaxID=3095076 RepID=A0ABZ0ZMU2_9ACTN|nr:MULTISPECIES: O-antigen ligase family protein [unclassified Nocardioides]MDZ5621533.1 O-antigen ligase family protein [Nocardioides sp. HM23]WQQ25630.1 O-antigen ligase family protein [Nocardioides sp. HM61]
MATDSARPVQSATVLGTVVVTIALVVAGAGLVTGLGHLRTAAIGVAALVLATAALVIARRSFAWLISAALVLRPIADLTANEGVGIPEILGVGMLLICIGWLLIHRVELVPRLKEPLTLPVLGLVVVAALSAVSSPFPMESIPTATGIAAGAAVYLVLVILLTTGRMSVVHLIGTLAASAVVPVLYPLLGLVGVTVSHEKDGIAALKSVFFLSNNFGHFLVPILLVAVAMATHAKGRARVAMCALAVILGAELLMTETRGAWIAAIVGIVIVGAVLDRRLLLGAIVLPVLLVAFVPSVTERVTSVVPDPADTRTESSLTWRFEHWTEVLPMVRESPVTGIGLDETLRRTGKDPHNDFLLVLVEMGLVGFAVYLWFLGAAVVTGYRATRRVIDPALPVEPLVHGVTVALFGYSVAFIVASSGENLLENLTTLWVVLPALAAVSWVAHAPRLALVRARRTPGTLRTRLSDRWTGS